jgi:hypothetical protein
MNKAFIREPDDMGQGHCPRCGSLGVAVGEQTLRAQLSPEVLAGLSASAFFCPYAKCDVVYFDMFERVVTTDSVAQAVWPKDPAAPICGCFGLFEQDIELDLQEGTPRRIRELLAKSKSPEARCATAAVSGQCCMADVQKLYMKRRGEG